MLSMTRLNSKAHTDRMNLLNHATMNKKFFPLLGLISLGIGFAICMLAYSIYAKDNSTPADENPSAAKSRYEMPHFVPVVRAAM